MRRTAAMGLMLAAASFAHADPPPQNWPADFVSGAEFRIIAFTLESGYSEALVCLKRDCTPKKGEMVPLFFFHGTGTESYTYRGAWYDWGEMAKKFSFQATPSPYRLNADGMVIDGRGKSFKPREDLHIADGHDIMRIAPPTAGMGLITRAPASAAAPGSQPGTPATTVGKMSRAHSIKKTSATEPPPPDVAAGAGDQRAAQVGPPPGVPAPGTSDKFVSKAEFNARSDADKLSYCKSHATSNGGATASSGEACDLAVMQAKVLPCMQLQKSSSSSDPAAQCLEKMAEDCRQKQPKLADKAASAEGEAINDPDTIAKCAVLAALSAPAVQLPQTLTRPLQAPPVPVAAIGTPGGAGSASKEPVAGSGLGGKIAAGAFGGAFGGILGLAVGLSPLGIAACAVAGAALLVKFGGKSAD